MLMTRVVMQPHPARWAQTEAIFLTDRLEWQRQHHRIPDYGFEVDMVLVNLIFESFVLRVREKLLEFDLKRLGDVDQTPNALAGRYAIDIRTHQNSVVKRLHTQIHAQLTAFGDTNDGVAEAFRNGDIESTLAHLTRAVHEVKHIDRVGGLDHVRHQRILRGCRDRPGIRSRWAFALR